MTKPQITLIITSVIFVVLIFQLPKVIIKNDKQLKSSTQTAQNTSGSAPVAPDEHTKSVNKEDLEKIEVLRKNYYSFSNKEKKLKFADSISRLYLKAMVFDSAAKFSAEVAALDPKPETWEKQETPTTRLQLLPEMLKKLISVLSPDLFTKNSGEQSEIL